MQVPASTFDDLIKGVTAWASLRPDIRALLMVGSYARGDARPDSDVDLILLCKQPTELLNDRTWINDFGAVERECVENWGPLTSVRVWYAHGLEVEFGVAAVDWAFAEGTDEVLRDSFRVLLDRNGLFDRSRTYGLATNSRDRPGPCEARSDWNPCPSRSAQQKTNEKSPTAEETARLGASREGVTVRRRPVGRAARTTTSRDHPDPG